MCVYEEYERVNCGKISMGEIMYKNAAYNLKVNISYLCRHSIKHILCD